MSAQAVLLVSHGSVDDLDDLRPFVTNVRRGRPPSDELIAELRHRYEAIGGSPLNRINAELARKLAARLGLSVAAANRLWKPTVRETLAGLARGGAERIAVVPLAQHSAHIYADDARRAAEGMGLALAFARGWGARDDLHEAFVSRILKTLSESPDPGSTAVLLTAHSLPRSVIEAGDPYERDFRAAATAIGARVRERSGESAPVMRIAFQSQGMNQGPVPMPWLGPDLRATLDEVTAGRVRHVILAPVGFLADHVEVLYDLDVEARTMAAERGLSYGRMPSLNADDDFVDILAVIAREALAQPADG